MTKVIALDSETTGVDLFHGALPFMVQTCDEAEQVRIWRWRVDPITRLPQVEPEDVLAIQEQVDSADEVAIHNAKYDVRALALVNVVVPWEKVRCTYMAHHLLASNHLHNLTDVSHECLGTDILKYEQKVEAAVKQCRRWVRDNRWLPVGVDTSRWRLADEGEPDMPSVDGGSKRDEDKPWKADMWLLLEVARAILGGETPDKCDLIHVGRLNGAQFPLSWLTVVDDYARVDVEVGLPLWLYERRLIERRKLGKIYSWRLGLLPVASAMEERGVTISAVETDRLTREYQLRIDEEKAECESIANQYGHELEMGTGTSDDLREMFWGAIRDECPRCGKVYRRKHWEKDCPDEPPTCKRCAGRKRNPVTIQCEPASCVPCLNLPMRYNGKSEGPSLDKDILEHYEATLEPGLPRDFIRGLRAVRSRTTAISYMEGYRRFWLPCQDGAGTFPDHQIRAANGKPGNWSVTPFPPESGRFFRLHPSANPCGTDTLRWGFYNPNSANISKKESFNLRRCFGPAPGRMWYSADAKNLELRIPAFEAGETDLIWVFEHPDDPPYFGSYHLVIFDLLFPDLFRQHGKAVKDLFADTWYQWVKNGNFAVIYGCGKRRADETYHCVGAFDLVNHRFPRIALLRDRQQMFATTRGWVETVPDLLVDPERGYPLLPGRGEDGRVSPTTTLNYHISGSAMWWTCAAMVATHECLERWNRAREWGEREGFITLQVHDELVFDLPVDDGNDERATVLKGLMERCGNRIGVPTPVSVERHPDSYAVGVSVC